MNTAKLLKDRLESFRGHAALYKLTPPLEYGETEQYEYVIVSAVDLLLPGNLNAEFDLPECETYIFPADADGNITSFGELPGSFQGAKDHARALEGAGYTIEKEGA